MTIYFFSILYFMISLINLFSKRKQWYSPAYVFFVSQLVMFYGILNYVDIHNDSDEKLIIIYVICLLMFSLGVKTSQTISSYKKPLYYKRFGRKKIPRKIFGNIQYLIMISIAIISIILGVYFFIRIGGNALLASIKTMFTSQNENILNMRAASRSFTGVGYITQFRSVLLPVIAFYFLFNSKPKYHTIGVILLPISIVFLLGTGQRAQFVYLSLVFFLYLFLLNKYKGYQVKKWLFVFSLASVIALFAILTVANKRVSSAYSDNLILGIFQAILKRFINDNQYSAVIGFRYIDSISTVWGMDWLNTAKDLLPGKNEYISVSSIIFSLIYGSTNGTSPPCIWGSAWLNWNVLGITMFPLFLGYFYQNIFYTFISSTKDSFSLLVYSYLTILSGFWIAGTPLYFFNSGVITVLLLKIILTISKKTEKYLR